MNQLQNQMRKNLSEEQSVIIESLKEIKEQQHKLVEKVNAVEHKAE